jgi:transcriptional activator SPT7
MHQRQGYDNKASEPFYDSLEGILHDLRTVTMVRPTHRIQRPPLLLMHLTRITMMRKRSSSQLQNRTFQITMTVRVICPLIALSYIPPGFVVISNPMDLQSMLKKVKAKQYKSKREFNDDLGLIWSNCFTYNATEASSPTIVPLFY